MFLALLGLAAPARGESHADFKTAYFLEGATTRQTVHVVHPQADLQIEPTSALAIKLGYDADIVTGATPRTYGAVDVLTSATPFSDVRHALHGGLEVHVGPASVSAGYTYAFESDYRSHAIDVGAKVDLWGKNTTFALGYAHNFDSVCDVDNRGASPLERRALGTSQGCFSKSMGLIEEPLSIDSYAVTLTQVLTTRLLGDLSLSYQVLDGFQSNPYRRVRLFSGTVEAQEAEPSLRQRVALQLRLRLAIPRLRAAIGGLGRLYWDTWDVKSFTGEITWEQYLAPFLLIRLRGRVYQQTRALFYRDAGEAESYESVGPVGQYFVGDRELSPFRNLLVGLKLSYLKVAGERGRLLRLFEAVDINLKLDLIDYQALSPLPPNKGRSDSFPDALLIQAGLALQF